MSKILVSLVSDQAMSNAFLIKNCIDYDKFVFITTEKMENKNKVANITDALNLPEDKLHRICVNQNDMADILEKLENVGFEFNKNEYLVNVTGGNKLMSIVVCNYFMNKDNTVICYLPIGNQFQSLTFGKAAPDTPKMLTLDEYVSAYGINIEECGTIKHSFNNNKKIFDNYRRVIKKLIKAWYDASFKKKFQEENSSKEYDIYEELLKLKDNTGENIFTKKDINEIKILYNIYDLKKLILEDTQQYITGGWFEEYICQSLKNAAKNLVDNNDIRINVKISNPKNELDVIFFYKNDIHIIECKTRLTDQTLTNALYKQKAISSAFGLNAKMYIFSMDNATLFNTDRAKTYGIKIVDFGHLKTEGNFLKNFGDLFIY